MTPWNERDRILYALRVWIAQRPGFDPHNYTPKSYRADARMVARQKRDALALLQAVDWQRASIGAEHLRDAFRAFSGRLSWDGSRLSYCAGQYWPTEYRAAACAVLASALWDAARRDLPPGTERAGDVLREKFRRSFGRGLASRWFS
jgi:hypothetical protein